MILEVEHIIGLSEVAAPDGLHLHLAQAPESGPLPFVTGYFPIARNHE
jgi:hypothetical protein